MLYSQTKDALTYGELLKDGQVVETEMKFELLFVGVRRGCILDKDERPRLLIEVQTTAGA